MSDVDVLAAHVEALAATVTRVEAEQVWMRHAAVVIAGGVGLQVILLAAHVAINLGR